MTDLWPMHLHNALVALARGLVEAGRKLEDVDRLAVLDLAERWRKDSYAKRAGSDVICDAYRLVARLMADLPEDGNARPKLVSEIARHARPEDDRDAEGFHIPPDMGPKGFFRHLVRQGILFERPDRRYTCPIPSFRRYLIESGGLDPDAGPPSGSDDDGSGREPS